MPIKKKNRKKSTSSKKVVRKKVKPTKKPARKTRTAKKSARKASASKKTAAKKKSSKKAASGTPARVSSKQRRVEPRGGRGPAFSNTLPGWRSGEQSGDLQGLSDVESADSESVDELLEEGNAFEAGVVSGVEEADRRGEKEVRTREVPEDDVPQEYLDED
jgi:hypothetical protein